MRIVQVSREPHSGSVHALTRALSDVAEIPSTYIETSIGQDYRYPAPDIRGILTPEARKALREATLIHFHNLFPTHLPKRVMGAIRGKPIVITWYDQTLPRNYPEWEAPIGLTCIVQNYTVLDKSLIPLPEVIPLREAPFTEECHVSRVDPITICWRAGSIIKMSLSRQDREAIPETLERLKNMVGIKVQILADIPETDVIQLMRSSSLGVDDLFSGSYSRSALEFLGLGVPVIADVDEHIYGAMTQFAMGESFPIITSGLENLESTVLLFREVPSRLKELSYRSREWMLKFWNESKTLEPYLRVYEAVMQGATSDES